MHHKLDIRPIPEEVPYVNDLSLTGTLTYETKDDMEKAVTGKKKSDGGILPDDNVRIYVPMDLNADGTCGGFMLFSPHLAILLKVMNLPIILA